MIPDVRPNTYRSYRGAAENQIVPFIGTKKLPITRRAIFVFNYAFVAPVKDSILPSNPVAKPKKCTSECGAPTPAPPSHSHSSGTSRGWCPACSLISPRSSNRCCGQAIFKFARADLMR